MCLSLTGAFTFSFLPTTEAAPGLTVKEAQNQRANSQLCCPLAQGLGQVTSH